MSALTSVSTLPARQDAPQRGLTALPRAVVRRGPRVSHGVVAIAGLGVIIGAQLGLSVTLSEGAYEVQSLQATSASLSQDEQALQEQLDVLEAPQSIALAAEDLGMEAGQGSDFLQLSNGAVLGGPGALHMQEDATTPGGSLLVGNELVQSAADAEAAAEAAAAAQDAEPEEYPGMLLPAEGVADDAGQ